MPAAVGCCFGCMASRHARGRSDHGPLADRHIEGFSEPELDAYEHLLGQLSRERPARLADRREGRCQRDHDTAMFRRLRDFHLEDGGLTGMAKSPADHLAPDRPLTLAHVADGAEGLVIGDLARAHWRAKAVAPATSALVICRDGPRMAALVRALAFFAPDVEVLRIPGLGLPALRPGLAACRRGRRNA